VQFRSAAFLGLSAGFITALIGASWQVVSRSASLTSLGPIELAVLRYAIPAILLLPIALRTGVIPRNVSKRVLAALVCGGGLPFGLLAFAGTRFAPASHMGVMIAATGPLITAALLWIIERQRISGRRSLGLLFIAAGVLLLGAQSLRSAESTWIGDVLFLLAAIAWGGYGIAFRRSGLTPWQGAALVNLWSAILLLPVVLIAGIDGFARADSTTLIVQTVWQSIVAGLFGLVTYTTSVRYLGASAAAAFGALVPVLSAVGGWIILGEAMTPTVVSASLLATFGVTFAVGIFDRTDKEN
jgi:drug/metabolite transporter (DMT)-like permease